ncbi:hypothetical protein GSI_10279 [Ganoderma sinense ZZ0214-1]|uniref:Uncharacterized protein n=1 Tax=Ganoderma sinense ZZ0214-1 TaxID=1077348 RepID=A0A2G8S0Q6_9APHY|nr:hypothetical protein GSI_10279 [Ganoderma sinense ZZ0214-1]
MPRSRAADKSKSTKAASQDALVILKDDMEEQFSNLYYHGWRNRSSEASLYPLYSLILTLSCLNTRHPNEPRISLMSSPQAFFGEVPPPGDEGRDPSDPSSREQTRQMVGQQRLLPSYQYPDFARLLIFAGIDDDDEKSPSDFGLEAYCDISEFLELKRLNCRDQWWSREAKTLAKDAVRQFISQVYDAAMAGFAYNPKWKTVYAILIVGVYFTQVCWESRPSEETLRPIIQTKVPVTVEEGAYGGLIAQVIREIKQYSNRAVPTVTFYNEPVFTYNPATPPRGAARPARMFLSSKFLNALSKPTTRFTQLSSRSTLFKSQPQEPKPNKSDMAEAGKLLQEVLIDEPTMGCQETARSLGHRFDGDPPLTPTPPNSTAEAGWKVSVPAKDVRKLPPLTIKTRAKLREMLFQEGEEGDEDADDGDDGEVQP